MSRKPDFIPERLGCVKRTHLTDHLVFRFLESTFFNIFFHRIRQIALLLLLLFFSKLSKDKGNDINPFEKITLNTEFLLVDKYLRKISKPENP